MPMAGGRYVQRDADSIVSFLEAELRDEYGEDIDLTESSAFRTFAQALANVDADDLEPAIQAVHDAAYIDDAEGEHLEKLVAILGVERREATHATGVVEFQHEATPDQTYQIDNGTIVATDSTDPIEFETTEVVQLALFDTFESGSLDSTYNNDTADFSVVDGSASGDPSPDEGSQMLKADAVDGSLIYKTANVTKVGSTMDFRVYLQDDTATAAQAANLFGVLDNQKHYRTVLDGSGRHAIEVVTSGSATTLEEDTSATVPESEWVRNEIAWSAEDGGTIYSRLYDSSGSLVSEISVAEDSDSRNLVEGGFGFQSLDGSENKYWDHSGVRSVEADARAREGGTSGNIGPNRLTTMPTVPSGVNGVTNPWPMGDTDEWLTSLRQFSLGLPRESDDELRERAKQSEGRMGRATIPSLIGRLTALDGAESVTVFENDTFTDNTGSGGLPEVSFEVVFYGTTDDVTVAETIFNTKAVTARDYGGANGSSKSATVTTSNNQDWTVNWSEPTTLDVDMTLDIVVNDDYVGDDSLRERIVQHVGGTKPDGTSALGTSVGEDVKVDQIEDVVTGPDDTGVIGIASYSFTPSTTTDSNGLEVVSVGSNEVAQTNGEDGSITLNVTTV